MRPVGFVQNLYRYPVKSMQGQSCERLHLTGAGAVGDRQWAFIDVASGKVVSAKRPKRWKAVLQCRAQLAASPGRADSLILTLPNGNDIEGTADEVGRTMTELLSREVRLSSAPTGPAMMDVDHRIDVGPIGFTVRIKFPVATATPVPAFVDYAPLHLLTTATLARLARLYPQGQWDPARFRPNVLIDNGDDPSSDDAAWLGKILQIGDVRVRVIDPCPRCVMTTLSQGQLNHDPRIWSALRRMPEAESLTFRPGKYLRAVAGCYGQIVAEGEIQVGDKVRLFDCDVTSRRICRDDAG
jgi:uncharacterized protein YcbX